MSHQLWSALDSQSAFQSLNPCVLSRSHWAGPGTSAEEASGLRLTSLRQSGGHSQHGLMSSPQPLPPTPTCAQSHRGLHKYRELRALRSLQGRAGDGSPQRVSPAARFIEAPRNEKPPSSSLALLRSAWSQPNSRHPEGSGQRGVHGWKVGWWEKVVGE